MESLPILVASGLVPAAMLAFAYGVIRPMIRKRQERAHHRNKRL